MTHWKSKPTYKPLPIKPPLVDPATGIWSKEQAKTHFFDEKLAAAIVRMWPVPPQSTADLGCGLGDYCVYFAACGWKNVTGYEGTPGISKVANYDNVNEIDLSVPHFIFSRDFVMCLEVGEHIPAECEHTFINNVVNASRQQLLLSWAVEGQSGVGHVNCHDNAYVVGALANYGFSLHRKVTTILREAATLPWFKDTLMWFCR